MKVSHTEIPGPILIEPQSFTDARGSFFESWNRSRYADAGVREAFVQDNVSHSRRGVLRGLHFQDPNAQGKLISVFGGEIYDVAVDIRVESATFGRWVGIHLSAANRAQFYIPPGFAHGFQVVSAEALVGYKCTAYYDPHAERSLLWSDPVLAIDWPLPPILSEKDRAALTLAELELVPPREASSR